MLPKHTGIGYNIERWDLVSTSGTADWKKCLDWSVLRVSTMRTEIR